MSTSQEHYGIEAGRCITRDGIPFVTIHPCKNDNTGSPNFPYTDSDDFARVAATAPELLEAAKDFAEMHVGRCDSCWCEISLDGYCGCAPLLDSVLDKRRCRLRKSIARAEWRQTT